MLIKWPFLPGVFREAGWIFKVIGVVSISWHNQCEPLRLRVELLLRTTEYFLLEHLSSLSFLMLNFLKKDARWLNSSEPSSYLNTHLLMAGFSAHWLLPNSPDIFMLNKSISRSGSLQSAPNMGITLQTAEANRFLWDMQPPSTHPQYRSFHQQPLGCFSIQKGFSKRELI